ncbi:hypothetical protein SMZ82_004286 [Cronobacter malonaticus]|uniref:hypothetical protein n=1 Tax=Cronobacter malonaticus TaxID=413503 RepID=UPI0012D2D511|nr:hypothetical protein [Cronobacter malonaticus]ELY4584899.1 hypothetical protein [Cronobacter malonaticus]ELY4805659.1 hypothetical protein [Cronobacter malonaticus]MDI6405879.1 hypothetical protein [Cronobacter malonaticus]
MDDMNFEALPPQQLYDMAVQVLDSSDASKLPNVTLQMLNNAKARALRNGAIAAPNDKGVETAKTLSFRERIYNAIRELLEESQASLEKVIKAVGDNFAFNESAFSNETSVTTAPTYHSPSFKKPLLVESYKWARAPPFVADST